MNLRSIFKINLNIAGVDEVGRGSLIGPVYASAVILKKACDIKILKDSKQLTKKKREILNKYIKKNSYWSIASASKKEIEKLNILNATLLAMQRAIKKLKKKPKIVLIDGNRIPKMKNYNLKYVIKGDQKVPQISAASIIAKVSRDNLMKKISKNFMKYQWIRNCGYGTRDHLSAIKKFGITKHHRKTFKLIPFIIYCINL